MDEIKPWMRGPFEMLKHAEWHFKQGTGLDARVAMISFDNSIEISITTYLKLHQSQRKNRQLPKDNIKGWLSDYHSKLTFFYDNHLREVGDQVVTPREEIIYYHEIRNALYHEGKAVVPDQPDISGIRRAAFWVFSNLFDVDPENLLDQNIPESEQSNDHAYSERAVFLRDIMMLRKDLNFLLRQAGILKIQAADLDLESALHIIESKYGNLPSYAESIITAQRLSDRIVHGEPIQVSDQHLSNLSYAINRASAEISETIKEYQESAIEKAVNSTVDTINRNECKIGIVSHTQGGRITKTITGYISRLVERPEIADYSILIISEPGDVLKRFIFSSNGMHDLDISTPSTKEEFEACLINGSKIVLLNLQSLLSSRDLILKNNKTILVFQTLGLGSYMTLFSNMPEIPRILFASHIPNLPYATTLFGNVICEHSFKETRNDKSIPEIRLEIPQVFRNDLNEHVENVNVAAGKRKSTWFSSNLLTGDNISKFAVNFSTHLENRMMIDSGKALMLVENQELGSLIMEAILKIHPDWAEQIHMVFRKSDSPSQHAEAMKKFIEPESKNILAIVPRYYLGFDVAYISTVYICKKITPPMLSEVISHLSKSSLPGKYKLIVDYVNEFRIYNNIYI